MTSIIVSDALSLRERTDTTATTERLSEATATSDTGMPLYLSDPRFLDPWAEVEPLRTWLEIGGRPAFPTEGLISISAKRKQGKSLAINALTIPLLTGQQFGNVIPLKQPRRIILFDTEMNNAVLQGRAQTVLRAVGKSNGAFNVCPLLSTDRDKRLNVIREVTAEYAPDIVVVDGVADLLTDINDYKEAAALLEELMRLAEARTVVCVLHQNKALTDEAMRGHIGSCLGNKSTENYSMRRANGIFELSCVDSRTTATDDAPTFKFAVDSNGNIITTESIFKEAEERRRADMEAEFAALFGTDEELRSTDIKKRIMERQGLAERAAEMKIATAKRDGIIKKKTSDRCSPYRLFPLAGVVPHYRTPICRRACGNAVTLPHACTTTANAVKTAVVCGNAAKYK